MWQAKFLTTRNLITFHKSCLREYIHSKLIKIFTWTIYDSREENFGKIVNHFLVICFDLSISVQIRIRPFYQFIFVHITKLKSKPSAIFKCGMLNSFFRLGNLSQSHIYNVNDVVAYKQNDCNWWCYTNLPNFPLWPCKFCRCISIPNYQLYNMLFCGRFQFHFVYSWHTPHLVTRIPNVYQVKKKDPCWKSKKFTMNIYSDFHSAFHRLDKHRTSKVMCRCCKYPISVFVISENSETLCLKLHVETCLRLSSFCLLNCSKPPHAFITYRIMIKLTQRLNTPIHSNFQELFLTT